MQRRSVRIAVLTLLLATPLAAASFLWIIDQQAADALAAVDVVDARLDRMRDALTAIGGAQQGYVAPGQLDEPWFERTDAQIHALRADVSSLRPLLRSPTAARPLDALAQSLDALEAADARTRENLSLGQDLMAADVIFSDGRNILDAMMARLRELHGAEQAGAAETLQHVARARWAAFGILMLVPVTIARLLSKARAPAVPDVPTVSDVPTVGEVPRMRETLPGISGTHVTPDARDTPAPSTPPLPPVDLATVAALCTDLARVTETATLSPLLERTAKLLNAPGLTLWMSAGEQLFVALGHGYPADRLARFGPIAPTADNVVAAAWRTGRIAAMAGEPNTAGALAVPLFAPGGCIGVLALEIRHGREHDPAVQAVAAMVAAQLATTVAAWPAASSAPAAEDAAVRSA